MTVLELGSLADAHPESPKRPFWRFATVVVALCITLIMTLLAWHVMIEGYARQDLVAELGAARLSGGWVTQLVLGVIEQIPNAGLRVLTLTLLAAAGSGFAFALLYTRLRDNAWSVTLAVVVALAVVLNAADVYVFTASARPLPLYLALAVLVPAVGALEGVGDVQSAIVLGLLMPLLLLASSITAPLILPFAIGTALANPDARRDVRALVAMLLATLLPSFIVAIGIVGLLAQAGINPETAIASYGTLYAHLRPGDVGASLLALGVLAPIGVVPILYCAWPGREPHSTAAAFCVVVLPIYLAVARAASALPIPAIVPAMALLASFAAWLTCVRLPRALQLLSIVLLIAAAALSWTQTGIWDDPAWKVALFTRL